jgi:spore coat polysaccharide biosynthesis protein SpsF
MKARKLVAAIACRNNGSRLYGKPLQNLDIIQQISILDNIVACLKTLPEIDEIVLGISEGIENLSFENYAKRNQLNYVIGDEKDVLSRLILCGEISNATDIFRVTSESPFLYFEEVKNCWNLYKEKNLDALFMDEIIDGCGFEIISLNALQKSHQLGGERHRSELCTLYLRENANNFNIEKLSPPIKLIRKDLRLTVDNPEDLVVCRAIYNHFKKYAPRIPLREVVNFLDSNSNLRELILPFTESGYNQMYK